MTTDTLLVILGVIAAVGWLLFSIFMLGSAVSERRRDLHQSIRRFEARRAEERKRAETDATPVALPDADTSDADGACDPGASSCD